MLAEICLKKTEAEQNIKIPGPEGLIEMEPRAMGTEKTDRPDGPQPQQNNNLAPTDR